MPSRQREAMRRHRNTRRGLASAAAAAGLLALVAGAREMWAVFGVSLIVSVLFTEAAGRAGHDYRTAAVRARRAEHITRLRSEDRQPVACCDTWVASAETVHGRHCDVGRWAA